MARVIDDPSLERAPGVKAGHECATFPLGIVEIPRVSWPAAFLPRRYLENRVLRKNRNGRIFGLNFPPRGSFLHNEYSKLKTPRLSLSLIIFEAFRKTFSRLPRRSDAVKKPTSIVDLASKIQFSETDFVAFGTKRLFTGGDKRKRISTRGEWAGLVLQHVPRVRV